MEAQARQQRAGLGEAPVLARGRAQRSPSMAEQVFRTLRSAIVTMRLKPGEALSEQEIAGRLNVSRQPVREAFIKLSEDGLVRVMPQRGTFVTKISAQAVTNARFVREAVECAIAREAAQRITPADTAALRALIADQRKAEKTNDTEGFFVLDEEFHRALAAASGCAYAWKVIESAKAQMDRVRFLSVPEATPMRRLIAQHQRILGGVASGNGDAAAAAMQTHLREILSSLPRLVKTFPQMFDSDTKGAVA
jgi:GntR family transcriptional regulator, rspAB operon transcriptional repressor